MKSIADIRFPPSSLAELRKLPSLLKRGELKLPMGKRLLVALCVMLDDPRLVATHTITELAQVTAVSPASLTQLADCSLISRNDSPLYTNSMVATQFLAETLLLQTARLLGSRAVERLSLREELINRLNDEF